MPDSFSTAQSSLSFAKLVATPTETAWAQAYNAGNLFTCIALTTPEPSEETSLQALGKDIFQVLQSEFFTLSEKNTTGIKQILQTSLSQVPSAVSVNLILAFFKDNTLLLFTAGSGKIVMRRDEKIGTLLQKQAVSKDEIHSASGFVKNSDTIILQTGPFAQGITDETLAQALELSLPTDIVEALSPPMHEQDNGAQAAIVITYRGAGASAPARLVAEELPPEQSEQTEPPQPQYESTAYDEQEDNEEETQPRKSFTLPTIKIPRITYFSHMSHRRKLFLNIALILVLLLAASVFLTLQKKKADQQKALFQHIYPQAKQDYETGQGLESLNPELSQENYRKAESLLKDGETKFAKGSDEYKQIGDLLSQVETALGGNTTQKTTATKEINPDKYSFLQVEKEHPEGLTFGEDANTVYMISAKSITAFSKTSGSRKDIINNDNDWSSPKAVVPYQGNVYVLDQKKGVLKFVEGSEGFGKSSYFKSDTPDLSQATGMAIDGSIWLVTKDGTLMQFTKGVSDNLKVTGLQKPFNNPTKLVTDITMEHVYILDQGNSRIVQLDKHGAYQNAYFAPIIAKATDFTVSEKARTIDVLSGGKVWQMSL